MSTVDWSAKSKNIDLNIYNVVDGKMITPDGEFFNKYSPRDGSLLYYFGVGTAKQAGQAIESASVAFNDGRWSRLPVFQRKVVMLRWAALIEADIERFALFESLDVGKPIQDALTIDLPVALTLLRYNVEAIDKLHGKVFPSDFPGLALEITKPRGVVAAIVGWNFPLVLAMMKIAPALITGNSVVLKPSELTSLSVQHLALLAIEAGLPEGVFNVVHGTGASVGQAMALHHKVDLLTFTGSSDTGKQLLIAAGQSNMKRLLLECGGKSPNIVFDDVDELEAVVEAVLQKMFWNQGQVCTSGSRLLLSRRVKAEFVEILSEKVKALSLGDPLDDATRLGPLVSMAHKSKVQAYIDLGVRDGARRIAGCRSSSTDENGFYVQPCVFDHVQPDHRIAQEEIFGPVLSVLEFDDDKQAIEIANATRYGLSATVWTADVSRVQAMANGLQVGDLTVRHRPAAMAGATLGSTPLEGHKQSGFGSESGLDGLRNYTQSTSLQILG